MATTEERKSKLQAAWHGQREAALSNWGNPNSEFAASRAADAAEAKARQEKHDAQIRAQVAAKAPDLYGPKRQHADPNQFGSSKMLPGGAPEQLKQLDLSGMKQKKGDGEQPAGEDSVRQTQAQQAQRLAGIQAGVNAQTRQQQVQNQKTEQADEETRQQREAIKRKAKAAMKRGAIFVAQFLLGAIGIGTAGIMFVVSIFLYAVTLGWLNIEMIYGKHLAKGKSRFISPISWEPIPMPIDKDAWILQGAIVAADVALGVVFVALSFFGYCFVHDFTKFVGSPAQTGAALAQGGGDLCLGAIIPGIFGL